MKLSIISESVELLKKVHQGILAGGSDLKEPLAAGMFTVLDIADSIKKERCLCLKHRDFGNTYLEQIVGNVIRDTLPVSEINSARRLFGLVELSPRELVQQQKNIKRGEIKSKLHNKLS